MCERSTPASCASIPALSELEPSGSPWCLWPRVTPTCTLTTPWLGAETQNPAHHGGLLLLSSKLFHYSRAHFLHQLKINGEKGDFWRLRVGNATLIAVARPFSFLVAMAAGPALVAGQKPPDSFTEDFAHTRPQLGFL